MQKASAVIKRSGLDNMINDNRFDNFSVKTRIQNDLKSTAQDYCVHVIAGGKDWLFFGGQSGSGKTHLCTAIAGELLKSLIPVTYMLWKQHGAELVALANDVSLHERLKQYTEAEVLYIDDFLKTPLSEDGYPQNPTSGHLNLAFVIIDARVRSNLPTIISSEFGVDELLNFDQATAGRIFDKSSNHASKPWYRYIPRGRENNYRIGGAG